MSDAYEALQADLRAGPTATAMLERRAGVAVRARVIATASPPGAAPRAVTDEGRIAYRRVQLVAGDLILSDADNWYLPDRLTPAMLAALAESDTPFGAVIAPLAPRRELLSVARVTEGEHALEVHALVRAGDGTLLAEVVEHYARILLHDLSPSREGLGRGEEPTRDARPSAPPPVTPAPGGRVRLRRL